jgi:uncharacterized membrane protein
MDRSLFLARLIGPTFVAIALGMLINLSIYERMIAEALRPGTLLYLSGVLSLLAGLAIINLQKTLVDSLSKGARGLQTLSPTGIASIPNPREPPQSTSELSESLNSMH